MSEVMHQDECVSYEAVDAALSIPEILEKILNYGAVEDLKNIRLVSKKWYDSARIPWRKLARATIGSGASMRGKSLSEYVTFLDAMDCDDSVPIFCKFAFNTARIQAETRLFQSFVDICGPYLTVLNLQFCFFENVDSLRNVLFKSFPNMAELSVSHCYNRDGSTGKITEQPVEWKEPEFGEQVHLRKLTFDDSFDRFGITWIELLSHYPNLRELNVEFCETKQSTYWIDELFLIVWYIRRLHPNKLQLTTITTGDIKCDLEKICVLRSAVLHESNLQLQSLALCVSGNNGAALLQGVVIHHGKFLRKLQLARGGTSYLDTAECFPVDTVLENLQELILSTRVFTTLGFLRYTRNLRRLSIEKCSNADASMILQSEELPELRDVKLDRLLELEMENIITVKELQLLMTWLPNVERLKMALDNPTFEQVCKGWPNLTKLEMPICDVDDCGITGLDPEQVKMVNEKLGQRPATVQRANITCLKHLRTLIYPPYGPEWDWCAFVNGFQQIPNLKGEMGRQGF